MSGAIVTYDETELKLDIDVTEEVPPPYTGGPRRHFYLRDIQDAKKMWPILPPIRSMFYSDRWSAVVRSTWIVLLGGVAQDRYVRWILEAGFFEAAGARKSVRRSVALWGIKASNHLYVEASEAGPWGQYIRDIVDDYRRVDGVFIQKYGAINGVPCECCERRYVRSDGIDHRRGLWPFHECVSLEGNNGGACGNCVFTIQSGNCSYHGDKPIVRPFRPENLPRPLTSTMNADTAPKLLHGMLDPMAMDMIAREHIRGDPTEGEMECDRNETQANRH